MEPYEQIAVVLAQRIGEGKWPVGSRLPDREYFCKLFAVGPSVIDQAISALIGQQWVDISWRVLTPPPEAFRLSRRHGSDALERVARGNAQVAHKIATELRKGIAAGTYPPGHVFTYFGLKRRFHVSTSTVSLACKILKQEGLIESRPRCGTRVKVEGETWHPEDRAPGVRFSVYIERIILQRIREGIYGPGCPVPSLHTWSGEFGVSMATMREVVASLKSQGILVVRFPRTYVSNQVHDLLRGQEHEQ